MWRCGDGEVETVAGLLSIGVKKWRDVMRLQIHFRSCNFDLRLAALLWHLPFSESMIAHSPIKYHRTVYAPFNLFNLHV